MKQVVQLVSIFIFFSQFLMAQSPGVLAPPVVVDGPVKEAKTLDNIKKKSMSPSDRVKAFFTHFHQKDSLALSEILLAEAQMVSVANSPSKGQKIEITSAKEFIKDIAEIPENITIEERVIEISEKKYPGIATVSTTYEFYINGEYNYNGVNMFTLARIEGQWQITGITDTRQMPF